MVYTKEKLIELAAKEDFGETYLNRYGKRCVLGWLLELTGIHTSWMQFPSRFLNPPDDIDMGKQPSGEIVVSYALGLTVADIDKLWRANDNAFDDERTEAVVNTLVDLLPDDYELPSCTEELRKEYKL